MCFLKRALEKKKNRTWVGWSVHQNGLRPRSYHTGVGGGNGKNGGVKSESRDGGKDNDKVVVRFVIVRRRGR